MVDAPVQAAEEIYVDVARACTENNLLKFSAKGYLLQAGICALCYASDDDMAIKLEQYRSGHRWMARSVVALCFGSIVCTTGSWKHLRAGGMYSPSWHRLHSYE